MQWPRSATRIGFLGLLAAALFFPVTAAHAEPDPEITFDVPPDTFTEEDGTNYLTLAEPSQHNSYTFSGSVTWSEDTFHIKVTGESATAETTLDFCDSDEMQPDDDSQDWECTITDSKDDPVGTFYDLSAEIVSDGEEHTPDPEPVGVVILATPEIDDAVLDNDEAELSGNRPVEMGVEVYDGNLNGTISAPDDDPLCSDHEWEPVWSCTIDASDWDTDGHEISARYVPIDHDVLISPFFHPSEYLHVNLEPVVAEPPDDPEPDPDEADPEPSDEPTPESSTPPKTEPASPNSNTSSSESSPSSVSELQNEPTRKPPRTLNLEPDPSASSSAESSSNSANDPNSRDTGTEESGKPEKSVTDSDPTPEPADSGAASLPSNDSSEAATPPIDAKGPGGLSSEPSTFGHELKTVAAITSMPPAVWGGSALIGSAFVIFVALPSELLHATLRSNYSRVFGTITPLWRGFTRFVPFVNRSLSQPASAALTLGIAAAISASAMASSLNIVVWIRLILAMFGAFVITNGLGVALAWLFGSRFQASPRFNLMPGFLVLSAASVLFSRLLGFQPAILFGILMVVAFGRELPRAHRGALATVFCGVFLIIGALAWLGYNTMDPATVGFFPEFVREFFTALATGGIGYCVIALLPMTYLEGLPIFRWSKWLWAGLYVLVLVTFQVTIMRMPNSWQELSGAAMAWCMVFGAFGVISLATWAWK